MSATYSDDELIKYAFDFDYAYSQYQMDSYVVNTGITDWRKAKQCLIEIEHRTQAMDDHGWNLKKMEAEIDILKEELAELTSPARQKLKQIEIDEKTEGAARTRRRIDGIKRERDRLIETFRKAVPSKTELDEMTQNVDQKEREYWISRIGKQAAQDMLSYGKIGTGNMESIMQMPHNDQEKIIKGALEFTKKMETGILTLEKEVEQKLIEQLKDQKDIDLIPKLEDTIEKNAKLLDSPESET
jgi:hypothetical protein